MNNKDCENLGYYLATCETREELREMIIKMDDRIKSEYEGFVDVVDYDEKVMSLAVKYMEDYNGPNWSLTKKQYLKRTFKQCMEDAKAFFEANP